MSLLNFESSGPSRHGSKKPFKLIFGIGTLVVAIALGSTFAASINLNSGAPVEFGQGVTQTVACDDEVTITPYSNFLNDGEYSDFYFTSFTVTGISESCNGKIFTIKAYSAAGSSPLNLYITDGNYDYNNVNIKNDNGSFSFVGGGLLAEAIEDIATGFRVTFTISGTPPSIADASAEDVYRITLESQDGNCEQGIGCEVGNIGPGGGTIFYVAQTPFTCGPSMNLSCTYLEAAPTTGTNAWVDSNYFWSGNIVDAIGADARGAAIGTGYRNTLAIVGQAGGGDLEDRAATDARAYRGPNNLTDWFIPSLDELTELFENRVITDISNSFDDFWSSTESDAAHALIEWFGGSADVYPNEKGTPNAVRPIRAF